MADQQKATTQPETAVMAQEFQTLRAVKGHFDGGAWNEDVDRWEGRKHQVMQRLLSHVLQGRLEAQQVRALMGQPDRIWPASEAGHARVVEQTEWQGQPAGELWSYHWRGEHDQLIIALDDGKVTAGGWLLAWE